MTCLVKVLRECADGRSGLFESNRRLFEHLGNAPTTVDKLIELGNTINSIRVKLGHDRFDLHEALLAARGRNREVDVSEHQIARRWLQLREASGSPDRYPHWSPRQIEDKDA